MIFLRITNLLLTDKPEKKFIFRFGTDLSELSLGRCHTSRTRRGSRWSTLSPPCRTWPAWSAPASPPCLSSYIPSIMFSGQATPSQTEYKQTARTTTVTTTTLSTTTTTVQQQPAKNININRNNNNNSTKTQEQHHLQKTTTTSSTQQQV